MMTRPGNTRWLIVIGLGIIALSVALAARGERTPAVADGPKRFAGATTVIPMPSALPAPALPSLVTVALVRDPAAASYYTKPASYDTILKRWEHVLRTVGARASIVAPADLPGTRADVLIVPSATCLSVATREALDRAGARGQGLVVTGATGRMDARCRPIGYGLLVALTGASRVDTLERREIAYVTFPHGAPLATHIPPGARLELDPAPYTALRRAGRDAFFSSFELRPAPAGDAPLLDGAVVHSRYRGAPVAYWSFELTGVNTLPWDQQLVALLVRNAIAWASGAALAELEPWPRGHRVAAVFAHDVEDQFGNARFALDSLRAAGVRGTYFLTSELARRHEHLTRAIAEENEIGTHSENHRLLGGEPPDVQRRRLALTQVHLRDLLGAPVRGLRPPEEQFDTATLGAWLEAGGEYLFGSNNARAAAPELLVVGGDTLVLLGRANIDDVNDLTVAMEQSLDALVERHLTEYQKVRALGGLYLLSYHSQLLSRPELVPALARIARRVRSDSTTWVATAGEIVSWWRTRASIDVRASRVGARALRVHVRNTGADTLRGAIARVYIAAGGRWAGAARVLPADPGVLRFTVPALAPGAARTFQFTRR